VPAVLFLILRLALKGVEVQEVIAVQEVGEEQLVPLLQAVLGVAEEGVVKLL
jgi:hypothetical protein